MKKDYKLLKPVIFISILLLFLSAISPYLFTREGFIDFSDTGSIGDTINGLMSPFIAILGAFLTFCAFYIQFDANRIQKDQIIRDKIETRIFNLIDIHRSNLSELSIKLSAHEIIYGHDCIVYLCSTIDFLDGLLQKEYMPYQFDKRNRKIFSYLYLCHGRYLLKSSFSEEKYKDFFNENVLFKLSEVLEGLVEYTIPKNGYANLLSRYFRQIYQIIKYIDNQTILSDNEKYEYAKILRSSLTNNEQILLFNNILSPYGKSWIDNGYITKYKIIKNIPLHLLFGYKPTTWFEEILHVQSDEMNEYFEYYEY